MPREFGKTWFSMFTDDDFCAQPRIDKLLYIVLLSQPALNYAGVQPMNLKRWRKALRQGDEVPSERAVKAALIRLERRDYVFTDDDSGETFVRTLIRNDGIDKQAGIMLSALRSAAAVESPKIGSVLLSELHRITLPEVKSDKPSADALRDNLKRQMRTAVTHLEGLLEGLPEGFTQDLPEPFAEDFPEGLPEGSMEGLPRPGEMEPLPEGFKEDSPEPPVVVEVEVFKSPSEVVTLGGRAREAENAQPAAPIDSNDPPLQFCDRHPNGTDGDCGACGARRRTRKAWDETHAADRARENTNREYRERMQREAAIKACQLCDHLGSINMPDLFGDGMHPTNCPHDADEIERGRKEILATRAEMADK